MKTEDVFSNYKIIPVVTLNDMKEAEDILGALCRGGLPVAEICFRTECAEEAIRFAVQNYPQMLVGAGTVINGEQCTRAISAGAKFIVSPGISEEAGFLCLQRRIPYLPGVVSPTEIIKAISLGYNTLKFFPAENYGGLKTIKALSAAFPQVRFVPTGGVCERNIKDYLAFDKVLACGGSWMVKGDTKDIEEKTAQAVRILAE